MIHRSKKWTIISSEYLIDNKWCKVLVDEVKLPNGVVIPDYYTIEYPNWICVLAITREQEFIFINQYRHGLKQADYELVAGTCDETDSSPLQTAQRELLEETGYGNGTWEQYSIVSANPSMHTNLCYCFLATDLELLADTQHEDTEDLEVVKFTLDEVKQLLLDDRIKQSMHTTPLWKYMAMNGLM